MKLVTTVEIRNLDEAGLKECIAQHIMNGMHKDDVIAVMKGEQVKVESKSPVDPVTIITTMQIFKDDPPLAPLMPAKPKLILTSTDQEAK